MRVYDLSHELDSETQVYPGDPSFSCRRVASIQKDGFNVTSLSLGSHTGTHIDAPSHFVDNGKTIDQVDLSLLLGPAVVLDVSGKEPRKRITWDELVRKGITSLFEDYHILILRTGWSKHWKTSTYLDHPFLDSQAAKRLLDLGMRVLGVDTMSPDETHTDEAADGDFGVHEAILAADGMIVENLTGLEQLPGIRPHVCLLPMKIAHCDGSPVRAIAWVPGTDD